MKLKVEMLVILAVFITTSVFAAKPEGVGAKWEAKSKENNAVVRVGDEIADSLADVLTGEESSKSKKGNIPPGLAKKDKMPPGWEKGKKTGWSKEESSEDSVIRKFFKNLFKGQETS